MVDKSEATSIEHGVSREDLWWGRIWKGTKEGLLAGGIVKEDWLADGSERDKRGRVVHSKKIEHAGRTFDVRRKSRRRYEVWESYSEAERIEREKRRELEKELHQVTELLASLPTSHQQFRSRRRAYVAKFMALPLQIVSSTQFAGYRYSPQALAEIAEARDELLRCLLQGETLFSAKARAEEIAGLKAKAAAADPGLQAFLKRVQQAP
jgi:hypothetical protein